MLPRAEGSPRMAADPVIGPGAGALSDALSGPESALILAPHLDDCEDRICTDLLTPAPPADQRVLVVTVTDSLGDAHRRWDRAVRARPAEFAIVGVEFLDDGESSADVGAEADGWLTTLTVRNPGDLTGLGVRISGQLGAWDDVDEQVVVCLRSLTAMLQYTDLDELVRFLGALEPHLAEAAAVSHFHLDPGAVDDPTVRSLSHAFDRVVEVSPDGRVEVSTVG